MWKIPSPLLRQWKTDRRIGDFIAPSTIDTPCPALECGRSLANVELTWQTSGWFAFAVFDCRGCGQRILLVMPNMVAAQVDKIAQTVDVYLFPKPHFLEKFEDGIREISPTAATILEQAMEAEANGLTELVGMGYRRALEFLIKPPSTGQTRRPS